MTTPEDLTHVADDFADVLEQRAREESATARIVARGQQIQSAMRERIDHRLRARRVAVVVAVVSLALVTVGAWVSCVGPT